MDAIRGGNRFGPSGTPDGPIDDLRPGDDLWAEVQAADLVPFPVDPPGGWQHGHDGFDLALDVGSEALADGLDFTAGPLRLADGLDLATDIAGFDAASAMPGLTFGGLDEISTTDPSDGIDSLDEFDDEDLELGMAGWGLDFLSVDGEDPPPLSPLDAAGDLTWADLAPAIQMGDGVGDGIDPDLDLDAPLGQSDLTLFTNSTDLDVAQLDGGARGESDDVVGAPLPMFVLDPLTGIDLDQVDATSALSQDTALPRFLDEDAVFADQYETAVV